MMKRDCSPFLRLEEAGPKSLNDEEPASPLTLIEFCAVRASRAVSPSCSLSRPSSEILWARRPPTSPGFVSSACLLDHRSNVDL